MGLIALGIAVVAHFFGHWLTAKLFGQKVAFVFPCCCASTGASQPPGRRALMHLGGPLVGYLVAVVPLTALMWQPSEAPSLTIASVAPGFPAATAGLQAGDEIIGIDGDRAEAFWQLKQVMATHPEKVTLDVHRPGEVLRVELTPVLGPDGASVIGVIPTRELVPTTLWNAIVAAHRSPLATLERALEPRVEMVGGPIVLYKVPRGIDLLAGPGFILLVTLMLFSTLLTLATLLPIPGLDGGVLAATILELADGDPVDHAFQARARKWLLRIGLVVGGLLVVVVLKNDVSRLLR